METQEGRGGRATGHSIAGTELDRARSTVTEEGWHQEFPSGLQEAPPSHQTRNPHPELMTVWTPWLVADSLELWTLQLGTRGLHWIKMSERSLLSTRCELWHWKVLPFGLTSAPIF